jgi:hypothetical protein
MHSSTLASSHAASGVALAVQGPGVAVGTPRQAPTLATGTSSPTGTSRAVEASGPVMPILVRPGEDTTLLLPREATLPSRGPSPSSSRGSNVSLPRLLVGGPTASTPGHLRRAAALPAAAVAAPASPIGQDLAVGTQGLPAAAADMRVAVAVMAVGTAAAAAPETLLATGRTRGPVVVRAVAEVEVSTTLPTVAMAAGIVMSRVMEAPGLVTPTLGVAQGQAMVVVRLRAVGVVPALKEAMGAPTSSSSSSSNRRMGSTAATSTAASSMVAVAASSTAAASNTAAAAASSMVAVAAVASSTAAVAVAATSTVAVAASSTASSMATTGTTSTMPPSKVVVVGQEEPVDAWLLTGPPRGVLTGAAGSISSLRTLPGAAEGVVLA